MLYTQRKSQAIIASFITALMIAGIVPMSINVMANDSPPPAETRWAPLIIVGLSNTGAFLPNSQSAPSFTSSHHQNPDDTELSHDSDDDSKTPVADADDDLKTPVADFMRMIGPTLPRLKFHSPVHEPKQCLNSDCLEWCANQQALEKHIKYIHNTDKPHPDDPDFDCDNYTSNEEEDDDDNGADDTQHLANIDPSSSPIAHISSSTTQAQPHLQQPPDSHKPSAKSEIYLYDTYNRQHLARHELQTHTVAQSPSLENQESRTTTQPSFSSNIEKIRYVTAQILKKAAQAKEQKKSKKRRRTQISDSEYNSEDSDYTPRRHNPKRKQAKKVHHDESDDNNASDNETDFAQWVEDLRSSRQE